MKYEINWEAPCFEEINALIAAGMPAEPLRETIKSITNELGTTPETKGRALSEGLRRLDAPPFRVYFHADDTRRVVTVSVLHFYPDG
jgi:hypothetical protein